MTKIVVCATNMKGRHHATFAMLDVTDGTPHIRVTRRAVRSLCGVPVLASKVLFVPDNGMQGCKPCNRLAAIVQRDSERARHA